MPNVRAQESLRAPLVRESLRAARAPVWVPALRTSLRESLRAPVWVPALRTSLRGAGAGVVEGAPGAASAGAAAGGADALSRAFTESCGAAARRGRDPMQIDARLALQRETVSEDDGAGVLFDQAVLLAGGRRIDATSRHDVPRRSENVTLAEANMGASRRL